MVSYLSSYIPRTYKFTVPGISTYNQQTRDEGVVTTRTQSNEFRVVTSSNEYLSPRNIVTEYLSSND